MTNNPSAESPFLSASLDSNQVRAGDRVDGSTLGSLPGFDPTMFHHRWTTNSTVHGEPMQFAVSRHLARLVAIILVDTTASHEEAKAKFEKILANKPMLENCAPLLNASVDVLDRSVTGLADATAKVRSVWERELAPRSLNSDEALAVIIAVSEQSCKRMLYELFRPPRTGPGMSRIGQEHLDCMSTVFGQRGDVEEIGIVLTRGRFSWVLEKALQQAHREYQALDLAMRARAIPDSIVNCAAKVELHQRHSQCPEYSSFKITPQGFRDAYIKASFDYGLVYAKDLRAKRQQ